MLGLPKARSVFSKRKFVLHDRAPKDVLLVFALCVVYVLIPVDQTNLEQNDFTHQY